MGGIRLTRRHRAFVGYVTGLLLIVGGTWVGVGMAAALVVAGVLTSASFLLMTDVEEVTGEPPALSVAPQRRFDPTL